MKRKLKLWFISNQDTGVQLYRINQPARFIAKQGLAKVHTLPFYGQHSRHFTDRQYYEYYAKEGQWADVLMTTLATDREYLALVLALKDRYKLKLVVDVDDDILATHTEPNNPAYRAYLDPRGKYAEYAQLCLQEADLVTVSTDYLKEKYHHFNKNMVVIKNTIDPEFFAFDNADDGPVIGYAGSGSHQADWFMLEPILERLRTKYPFKVKMLGPMHVSIEAEQVKWVDMLRYPDTLSNMGFTIGLAPLKDSLMNRAKSNLRWLEYSALKIPTIASDVVPFKECQNIIKVQEPEEWETAIEALLTNPEEGTRLGEAAYNEVRENYDPNFWSSRLYNAIEQLFSR